MQFSLMQFSLSEFSLQPNRAALVVIMYANELSAGWRQLIATVHIWLGPQSLPSMRFE